MAYNNNYNNFDFGSARMAQNAPRRSYVQKGYNRGVSFNGYQAPPKRSGSKFQVLDGSHIISAWRVSKGQMFSLYARPYKNSKIKESKNGKEWVNLFVTIVNKTTMQETKTSGMLDINTKRLYIKDFNLIVTNKGRGGYFGKHISSSYNR